MNTRCKRFIAVVLIVLTSWLNYGCAGGMPGYKQVASIDDLSIKPGERQKMYDWWKESPSRAANGFRVGMLAGMTIVLLPVLAVGVASIPAYHKDLTIQQIAEFAAANAMDEKQLVWYHDSRGGGKYQIMAWPNYKDKSDDENWNKTILLNFINKEEKRVYREAWIVDKSADGKEFVAWKSPLFINDGADLAYIPDNKLKGKTENGGIDGAFDVLFVQSDGTEIRKDLRTIPTEFRIYYATVGGKLTPMMECDGEGRSKAEAASETERPSTNPTPVQDQKPAS